MSTNKMKNSTLFHALSMLLLAGAMLTACSSDESTPEPTITQIEAGKTYHIRINAAKGGSTRALAEVGNAINATWETREKIYVKYNDSWFGGFLQPQPDTEDPSWAWLSGDITSTTSFPLPTYLTLQFPRNGVIDYTGQVGTLADIAAKYDYATARAWIVKVNGQVEGPIGTNVEVSEIRAAESVTFANQQAIVKFTLKDNQATPATINASSLRISATDLKTTENTTGDITITPNSPTDVIYAALSGINNAQVTLTANVGGNFYTYQKEGVTLSNGNYYNIEVQMHSLTYPKPLNEVTTDYIGSVVGANGYVYPNANAATTAGTTAVAMIAYVGSASNCTHGLAIALTDENGGNAMLKDNAQSFIDKKSNVTYDENPADETPAVIVGTWRLPYVNDWKYMFIGCGNGANIDDTTVNYTCFNAKLFTAIRDVIGGTTIGSGTYYWNGSSCTHFEEINVTPNWGDPGSAKLRACLAF